MSGKNEMGLGRRWGHSFKKKKKRQALGAAVARCLQHWVKTVLRI
jgi:hypothetical protein